MGALGAGDNEQPRGVPVEAVDDARPAAGPVALLALPPALAAVEERGEELREGVLAVAAGGVDD